MPLQGEKSRRGFRSEGVTLGYDGRSPFRLKYGTPAAPLQGENADADFAPRVVPSATLEEAFQAKTSKLERPLRLRY